jgi:hypothetical protein
MEIEKLIKDGDMTEFFVTEYLFLNPNNIEAQKEILSWSLTMHRQIVDICKTYYANAIPWAIVLSICNIYPEFQKELIVAAWEQDKFQDSEKNYGDSVSLILNLYYAGLFPKCFKENWFDKI